MQEGDPETMTRKRERPAPPQEPQATEEVNVKSNIEQPAAQKRQKSGGGGAWRYFVHSQLAGSAGGVGRQLSKELMQELQRKYWEMTEQEWEHCKRMGSQGLWVPQKSPIQ